MGFEHSTPGILILLAFVLGPVLYYISKVKSGSDLFVRRIPGVDSIDQAVGRAVEQGRPVSFSTGLTSLSPVLYACLGVLNHIAAKVAQYKNKLLIPQNDPEVMAVVESTVRDAYRSVGRANNFDPASIIFLSSEQFAFASGYMGMLHRENAGAAFLFGSFAAESLILAEAGQQIGAMQVAASVSPEQVPFFICACDYTLIGEELYAASAYLTKEAVQLGSLFGQDRVKLLFLIMIIIGCIIATINSIFPQWQINNLDYYLMLGW